MNLSYSWVALVGVTLGACDTASAPGEDVVDGGVTQLTQVAANHNRVVGSYRGEGRLPDGRSIVIQLAARPTAELDVVIAVDGHEVGQAMGVRYDLRDGSWWLGRAVAVAIDAGQVRLRAVPVVDGWTQAELVLVGARSLSTCVLRARLRRRSVATTCCASRTRRRAVTS